MTDKEITQFILKEFPYGATVTVDMQQKVRKLLTEARKKAASDIFNLAHEYASADDTMMGAEELRGYHYAGALAKIGEFPGR